MLAPETRALLTDALRPPEGSRVDLAVTTTCSLDLTALLLAPMSFALHETGSRDIESVDGVALLESLCRYADRTTVFCQAGGIHLPASFSPLLQFLEDSVIQVAAPKAGAAFHPKIWVLRFVDTAGTYSHRVLVASRNLTFDRCWDTLLRLDEASVEVDVSSPPDTAPLADFVAALPTLAGVPLGAERRAQIDSVVQTVRTARFALPSDIDDLRFLPLGLDPSSDKWPFPPAADRALFISPFLSRTAHRRAVTVAKETITLSRPDALNQLRAADFGSSHTAWTMQRGAEVEAGQDATVPDGALWEGNRIRDGLHAKTSIVEVGDTAVIVTGSANLTTAGYGANVEFDVVMTGAKSSCGIATVWDGPADNPGLARLCSPYELTEVSAAELAVADAEQRIAAFHAGLALGEPTADVSDADEDDVARLELMTRPLEPVGETFVWPVSLRASHGRPLEPSAAVRWERIARPHITPFFVVETVLETDGGTVRAASVIKATLTGDVGDRRQMAMRDILRTPADVLRYLALLLADPSLDAATLVDGLGGDGQHQERRAAPVDVVLLEPLIRASSRSDDALQRVASLLEDLKHFPGGGDDLVPTGLEEIWSAVWAARGVRR